MAMIQFFSSQFIAHHLPHQFIWRPLGRLCSRRPQKDKNGEDGEGDCCDFEVTDIQHYCDSAYYSLLETAQMAVSRAASLNQLLKEKNGGLKRSVGAFKTTWHKIGIPRGRGIYPEQRQFL